MNKHMEQVFMEHNIDGAVFCKTITVADMKIETFNIHFCKSPQSHKEKKKKKKTPKKGKGQSHS